MTQTIGDRIVQLRQVKGLNQRQLSTLAKINNSTLHRLESNATRRINMRMLQSIADALETTVAHIMGENPTESMLGVRQTSNGPYIDINVSIHVSEITKLVEQLEILNKIFKPKT